MLEIFSLLFLEERIDILAIKNFFSPIYPESRKSTYFPFACRLNVIISGCLDSLLNISIFTLFITFANRLRKEVSELFLLVSTSYTFCLLKSHVKSSLICWWVCCFLPLIQQLLKATNKVMRDVFIWMPPLVLEHYKQHTLSVLVDILLHVHLLILKIWVNYTLITFKLYSAYKCWLWRYQILGKWRNQVYLLECWRAHSPKTGSLWVWKCPCNKLSTHGFCTRNILALSKKYFKSSEQVLKILHFILTS